MEPTRARPVPFCFHSFLPAPETSFLFLVACVPARCAERKCLTASQRRSSLIPPKTSSASSSVPVFLPSRFTTSILAMLLTLVCAGSSLLPAPVSDFKNCRYCQDCQNCVDSQLNLQFWQLPILAIIFSPYQQRPSWQPSTDPAWSIRQSHGARAVVSLPLRSRHTRPSDRAPRLPPATNYHRCRCLGSSGCAPSPGPRPCGRTCAFQEIHVRGTTKRRSSPAPGTCVRARRDRRRSDDVLRRRQSRVPCSRRSHPRTFHC